MTFDLARTVSFHSTAKISKGEIHPFLVKCLKGTFHPLMFPPLRGEIHPFSGVFEGYISPFYKKYNFGTNHPPQFKGYISPFNVSSFEG